MHRPRGFLGAKRADQPLDLSPMAEFENVLGLAALLGADRGLERRFIAEIADQILGIGEAAAAGDEERVHELALTGRSCGVAHEGGQYRVSHTGCFRSALGEYPVLPSP